MTKSAGFPPLRSSQGPGHHHAGRSAVHARSAAAAAGDGRQVDSGVRARLLPVHRHQRGVVLDPALQPPEDRLHRRRRWHRGSGHQYHCQHHLHRRHRRNLGGQRGVHHGTHSGHHRRVVAGIHWRKGPCLTRGWQRRFRSLGSPSSCTDGIQGGHVLGDMLALVSAVCTAAAFTIIRASGKNVATSLAVGSLSSALIALVFFRRRWRGAGSARLL